MKIVSDKQVVDHLLSTLNRESIVAEYHPALLSALQLYEENPEVAPERTVRTSNTDDCDTTHLFMPCIAPHAVGLKVISGGPQSSKKGLGFQGALLVLDEYTGEVRALVNAKSLTAFRTGLASSLGLVKVHDPSDSAEMLPELLVFGAGPQAFWHAVLAGRLYEGRVKRINVVSRSLGSAQKMADDLASVVKQEVFAYALGDDQVGPHVQNSSIVFGCTPSTEGIILKEYINSDPTKRKFISLIGSYKPHMHELDLGFISQYYTGHGVKVLADSKSHALAEAGELIQGKIGEDQLVSLTELNEITEQMVSAGGVVLLKIVGLLIMDVVMAKFVMERTEGTELADF